MLSIINYLGFQIGWFACVAGAGRGLFYLGPSVCVALLSAHLYFAADRTLEAMRLLAVCVFGLTLEIAGVLFGCYAYAGSEALIPLWVVALWLLFAATLNSSMSWLSARPVLAAVLGAIAGPLSFRAGVSLSAAEYLVNPAAATVVLSGLWALALPGAFFVSRRLSGGKS